MTSRREMLVIVLLASSLTWAAPAVGEEVSIEATIPRDGDFMGFGFNSLWMMSGGKLARISAGDNSVLDIPVKGAVGQYRSMAVGEGAVWCPMSAAR